MVQAHHDSREAGTTKPFPLQETEMIWHVSSDPQKVLQLHHQEHPDWLHHCLVRQLLGLRPQGITEDSVNGPVNHWGQTPAIQDLYTRRCQRKALKIVKDSRPPCHRLFSLLLYRSSKSRSVSVLNSFYPKVIRLLNV
jgi:hypothetical protein